MSYENDRKDTLKTLKKEGAPCKLLKPTGAVLVYDPATDSMVTPTTEHSGYCVLIGFDDGVIDGTLIQAGDVKIVCLFEDKSIPEVGKDKIVVNPGTADASTYSVVPGSKAVMPDGKTCILYKAQGRK